MDKPTQAEIESKYFKCKERILAHELDFDEAFSNPDDWIVQFANRKAALNPVVGRWFWFHALGGYWQDTGRKPGEVLLIPLNDAGLAKALPQSAIADAQQTKQHIDVGLWCVAASSDEAYEPMLLTELSRQINEGKLSLELNYFSGRGLDWKDASTLQATPGANNSMQPSGQETIPVKQFCAHCGGKLESQAKFCSYCGKAVI